MSGYLLDTNVLSELRKESRCDDAVREWLAGTATDELYVSVLVLGEIRQGIERIRSRDAEQARVLERWLQKLRTQFADRILPVDARVADQWGCLGLRQPVPILDAFLAATALIYDLTVVSRDEVGFRNAGVRVINPFIKT